MDTCDLKQSVNAASLSASITSHLIYDPLFAQCQFNHHTSQQLTAARITHRICELVAGELRSVGETMAQKEASGLDAHRRWPAPWIRFVTVDLPLEVLGGPPLFAEQTRNEDAILSRPNQTPFISCSPAPRHTAGLRTAASVICLR